MLQDGAMAFYKIYTPRNRRKSKIFYFFLLKHNVIDFLPIL